jgi:hypothetical protein
VTCGAGPVAAGGVGRRRPTTRSRVPSLGLLASPPIMYIQTYNGIISFSLLYIYIYLFIKYQFSVLVYHPSYIGEGLNLD